MKTKACIMILDTIYRKSGLKDDFPWRRFFIRAVMLSLVLHFIAAVMSGGFYHNDEHFQILEFVNAKLGRSPFADLPLEFREVMRPWLLPAILTGLTRVLESLGIHSPLSWAMTYRFFASLIGWIATVGL